MERRGEGEGRGRDGMVNRRYNGFLSLSFQCYSSTLFVFCLFVFPIMCCISEITEKMLKIQ